MWTLGSAHSCGQDSLSSRPVFLAASAGTYRSFVSTAAFRQPGRHGCSDHSPRCSLRACSQPVSLQRAQPPFSRRSSLRRGPSVPRATRSEPEQQQQLPPYQQQHRSSTWASTLRTVLGAGLLLAVGILGASKQAGAATSRQGWDQHSPTPYSFVSDSTSRSDAEPQTAAAERSQEASCSSSGSKWQDTGIELARGNDKDSSRNSKSRRKGKEGTMTLPEWDKYAEKEFGEDPKYSILFRKRTKPKKVDVMQSQVPDPAGWDEPEFKPMTAWREDRMKDLTYTQLWLLIKERKVDHVKFSHDHRTVLVTTKASAPGGRRTEKVALPYDPDLFNHMIEHDVRVEVPPARFGLENVIFGCTYLLYPVAVGMFLLVGTLNLSLGPPSDEDKLFKGAKLERLDQGQSKLTFADIAGIDAVKAEVQELVEFLRNPLRFTDLGAHAPAGVLLVGSPGTGKTLLAKAVAGEAGVPFLSVAGTEFDQLYVGIGAARVRDMFRQAREAAPCILFIDEFDGIGKQRSMTSANDSANTLNSLLIELDGFEDNTGVIVMAATNRPSALDSALTRPGRFDRVIQLPLPSVDGREAILRVHARNKKMAPKADFKKVARATGGYTGAMLMNVMNTAAILAVRRGSPVVTTDDMFSALEAIQQENYAAGGGLGNEDDQASPSVRRGIAVYEAARALMGAITPFYDEVAKVVCCQGGQSTGYTHFIPSEEQLETRIVTRAYMEAKMVVALAGRCSERLLLGDAFISTAGAADLELANLVAREMVYKCGFSRRLGPVALMDSQTGFLRGHGSETMADIGTELAAIALTDIKDLVEGAEAKAMFGLAVNYKPLQALVETLERDEVLTGGQVADILEANGAARFPDPFVEGFGFDENSKLVYPGMPKEGNGSQPAEGASVQPNEAVRSRSNGTLPDWVKRIPPYPYKVRDDLEDLIGDELEVLQRL